MSTNFGPQEFPVMVDVPAFVHVPRAAFEEGIVFVSAPDLNEEGVEELQSHIIERCGLDAEKVRVVVTNYDLDIIVLNEDRMRELGWVRA